MGREEVSLALFENQKKCPDFGKNPKVFPYGASFSCVFDEIFIEVP